MNRTCIINVYFGKWPDWIHFFLQSCKFNPEFTFLLFNDFIESQDQSMNIIKKELTIQKFNSLASKKLGFSINLSNPYKLCDFKPAYGIIFEDYLKDYDYWGYCDIDLIFGNISKFITQKILSDNDVFSTYQGFLSGPFALYKNSDVTANLYTRILNYKSLLRSEKHYALDENIERESLKGITLGKTLLFIGFILMKLFRLDISYNAYKEMRYQFQWFCKRRLLKSNTPVDITESVIMATRKGEIKSFFKELILSENHFERKKIRDWNLIWKNGVLKIFESEIFAFHWRESLSDSNFSFGMNKNQRSVLINKKGIKFYEE